MEVDTAPRHAHNVRLGSRYDRTGRRDKPCSHRTGPRGRQAEEHTLEWADDSDGGRLVVDNRPPAELVGLHVGKRAALRSLSADRFVDELCSLFWLD